MKPSQILLLTLLWAVSIGNSVAQEITMFPGLFKTNYYADGEQVSKADIENTMQSHQLPEMYWNISKTYMKSSYISLGVQFGTFMYHFVTRFGPGFRLTPLVVSIGAGALSIGFTIAASKHRKKAILRYNHIKSDDTFLLHIGQTHNGVGLVVTL